MKFLKNYKLFKEAIDNNKYTSKNIVHEICTSMVLLNNDFLNPILDMGLKARYSENSQIFLTDLKNLILGGSRLKLGQFINDKCEIDDETAKINQIFQDLEFNIEVDWDKLVNARNTARSIQDKLFGDEKLNSDDIKTIYWLGPNKKDDYKEDIVIEMKDGNQYSFYLNKNISNQKTASFNTFADDLIGNDIEKLYGEEYIQKWNKLTQEWVRNIYENANKDIQSHIEKFIDPRRIDTMGYFEYFDIRHTDPKFKHLGEFIKEFDKNILKFSDLISEIWKNKEMCFMDVERVVNEWMETKIVVLNSKILENLLTNSLKTNYPDDIKKLDNNFKLAGGTVKMKLFKTLVEKMGCSERRIYYVANGGKDFNLIPSREFFRKNYDNMDLEFDYHQFFKVSDDEDNNDFCIKLNLLLEDKELINMQIVVKFSSEMSGRLSAKYKYTLCDDFNYTISRF